MFHEYVLGALNRAKVQPIQLPTPLLDALVQHVESRVLCWLLVAGKAGDGKSYPHCRALWACLGG